ncbi:MAG: hypothetical protein K8H87_13555 [Pseudorhodoplanes sp.]|nr:hypothetical protein [Pseudorhodoplanes sp.]
MAKGWSSAQTPRRGGRESVSVMKGEVDSSILSGSTIPFKDMTHLKDMTHRPRSDNSSRCGSSDAAEDSSSLR